VATRLGRAREPLGIDPSQGLGDKKAEDLAQAHGVRAKHSLESTCARKADVFTTVSEITAAEAELLHGRRADVLVPNGLDLAVVDQLAAGDRGATRAAGARLARAFLREDGGAATLLPLAGRYPFPHQGLDPPRDPARPRQ